MIRVLQLDMCDAYGHLSETDVAQNCNIYNDLRDTTNIPAVIWAAIVSGLALLTVILWFIFHLFNIGSKAPLWFPLL